MEFEQEGLKTQENTAKKNPMIFTKNLILVVSSLILLFLIVLVLVLSNQQKNHIQVANVPIITPPAVVITATPAPIPPKWASSSAILKIDNDIRDLKTEIDNTDFSESVLALPSIDTKVDFTR